MGMAELQGDNNSQLASHLTAVSIFLLLCIRSDEKSYFNLVSPLVIDTSFLVFVVVIETPTSCPVQHAHSM